MMRLKLQKINLQKTTLNWIEIAPKCFSTEFYVEINEEELGYISYENEHVTTVSNNLLSGNNYFETVKAWKIIKSPCLLKFYDGLVARGNKWNMESISDLALESNFSSYNNIKCMKEKRVMS